MKDLNLLELLGPSRNEHAASLLIDGIHLVGAAGERSVSVALEAAKELFGGSLLSTIYFMNRRHPWLNGQTPLERAEESDEGRDFVISMIGAIAAGVYV